MLVDRRTNPFSGNKFLGGPQNMDEAKQDIDYRVEKAVLDVHKATEECCEKADDLKNPELSEDRVREKFSQRAEVLREKMHLGVNEYMDWAEGYTKQTAKILHLNGPKTAELLEAAEGAFSYVHLAFQTIKNFFARCWQTVRDGSVSFMEAIKGFVEKAKEVLSDAISGISQAQVFSRTPNLTMAKKTGLISERCEIWLKASISILNGDMYAPLKR